jgi:GTP pyrophosphokinase
MKGARVNGRWTVLDAALHNGDIVEIITQKNNHPSLDWLNFVVTPSARNKIRQWYKRSHREENINRGRELLEKELGKSGLEALLKSPPMQTVAEKLNYQAVEDLLAALGYGEVTLNQIVNRIRENVKAQQPIELSETSLSLPLTPIRPTERNDQHTSKSPIAGVEGLLYYVAGCCKPLPGEPIIGVVTRSSKGISIHHQGCSNVDNVPGERLIPVSWNPINNNGRPQTYTIDLQIEVIDRVGVFKDILARFCDQNINVRKAGVKTSFGKPALISVSIDLKDHQQLESIISQIRKMSDTLNVRRVSQVDSE